MSNYADEANTEDAAAAAEEDFAPAGSPDPGPEADSDVNPVSGPEGDVTDEGMETPIAPSGS